MELKDLTEDELDLVYFALNHALDAVSARDSRLPFLVTDGPGGREVTWLDEPAQAYGLEANRQRAVVHHDRISSDDAGQAIPAVIVELSGETTDETVVIAQLYRPGSSHRRFAVLSEPYCLHGADV
jgi:hypothetical protein